MELKNISTDNILDELYSRMRQNNFSKHCIENISKGINRIKVSIYPNNKHPLYGNLSRFLTDEEFNMILGSETSNKLKLCYLLMYFTGLRESEAVIIKISDISDDWVLRVHNIKCKRTEYILIPECIREDLSKWITSQLTHILDSGGHIFFSQFKKGHISKDKLRSRFRDLSIDCGINQIYDQSKDGRNLYRYSLHSLRYSFGVRFYYACGCDIVLTSQALRHRDIKTTMTYLRQELCKIDNVMRILR